MKTLKYHDGWRYGDLVSLTNGTDVLDTFVYVGIHAEDRAEKRLSELGIRFGSKEEYVSMALDMALTAISDELLNKYLTNLSLKVQQRQQKDTVIVHTQTASMSFVLEVSEDGNLYLVTLYSKYNSNTKDIVLSSTQRECWLYDEAMRFTTREGMCTWIKGLQ